MIYGVVLGLVVAVLLSVAIWKMMAVRNRADFLVAGRTLPWHVLVFTLLSSWIGAGSLFAGGEAAYRNGFAAMWVPAGGWTGLIVIFFIAARARRFAQFTVPDLLESRYNAARNKYALVELKERIEKRPLPKVELIDMRLEFLETRQQSLFSRRLRDAIDERVAAREQVMVLLNRRGFATFVACRSCGESARSRTRMTVVRFSDSTAGRRGISGTMSGGSTNDSGIGPSAAGCRAARQSSGMRSGNRWPVISAQTAAQARGTTRTGS